MSFGSVIFQGIRLLPSAAPNGARSGLQVDGGYVQLGAYNNTDNPLIGASNINSGGWPLYFNYDSNGAAFFGNNYNFGISFTSDNAVPALQLINLSDGLFAEVQAELRNDVGSCLRLALGGSNSTTRTFPVLETNKNLLGIASGDGTGDSYIVFNVCDGLGVSNSVMTLNGIQKTVEAGVGGFSAADPGYGFGGVPGTSQGMYRLGVATAIIGGAAGEIYFGQQGSVAAFGSFSAGTGNLVLAHQLQTEGGPAWKFGAVTAGAVALDAANYVAVTIGGVAVKLLKAV